MSKHSARGTRWQAQRRRVLDRDGWTCCYCGRHLEGLDATVDHIEPIALDPGRTYADTELVSACRRCNGTKADKQLVRLEYANATWLPNGIPK